MATYASSNRTALSYIEEATFGTDPGTAKKEIRYTGESLNFNISNTVSDEIRSDRQTTDLVQVSAEAAGDINIELSYGTFDDFMEGAFASDWQVDTPGAGTDTLENGVVLKSYSIDKELQDANPVVNFGYTGMRVGSMSLSFSVGSIVTGSFSFMGLDTVTGAAASPAATSPSTTNVMNAVGNVSGIEIDGGASTACYNSFEMTLSNALRGQDCIGTLGHSGVAMGRLDLTGSINIYFVDAAEFTKFKAGTAFSFQFTITDAATNAYTFLLPELKYETLEIVSGGLDSDMMVNATWRAILDSAAGTMIEVARTPV